MDKNYHLPAPEPTPVVGNNNVVSASHAQRRFIPKTSAWSAQWIWLPDDVFPEFQTCRRTLFCKDEFPYTMARFRKVVDLPFVPARIIAWISADTRYRCSINGKIISRGPAEVGGDYDNRESPDWWFYDGLELRDCMRPGRNVITAEVVLGPQVQAGYSMGRGGFLLELFVEGPDGKSRIIGTDRTWQTTRCQASSSPTLYDARRETTGWDSATFDDGNWKPARELNLPEERPWNLLPRDIPPLAESRILPVEFISPNKEAGTRCQNPSALLQLDGSCTISPGTPVDFLLRFPRELTGYLYLDVTGACGTRIDVEFRELPGTRNNRSESFILPDNRWTHETLRLQGFEWIHVTVSFPEHGSVPLEIHALDARFTSFPVTYRGQFECPDSFLNQLWAVGRWTNQLCMQSYHLDSPIHQEGLGCTGDYMIEALISYCCFGESRLARKDILRTAYLLRQKQGRMFHTSYSLLWVWMVMDYLRFSDDRDTVRTVLPDIHALLDRFASYLGATGLITEAPNYMFMDWVPVGDFNLHHPPASMGQGYLSAFYYRALQYAATLSRINHDGNLGTAYDQRAETIKQAFNTHLWDAGKGLYRDGLPGITRIPPSTWLPADPAQVTYTVHTNALAVALGIAGHDSRQAIMRKVMEDPTLPVVQPYFMHVVFEALAEADLFDSYAFTAMNRWQPLLAEHPTSMKEAWDWGDYSHAWGCTPTWQLSTRVLGVAVQEPGWNRFLLDPHLGPLPWATGVVPTPRGPIVVAWTKHHGLLSGTLAGPAGCTVILGMKNVDPSGMAVAQNGELVPLSRETGRGVSWVLRHGTYQIQIRAGNSG